MQKSFSLYATSDNLSQENQVLLKTLRLAVPVVYLAASALAADATPPSGEELLASMATHQLADNKVLTHYTGMRRYTLHNVRFGVDASMTVRIDFRHDTGKRFTLIAQTGPARVRQRVFDALLKTEAEESRPGRRTSYALDTTNYQAQLIGREMLGSHDCWVLSVEPKRRSRFLIRGKLWIDVRAVEPVQLQGRPTGSVSFWVGEPLITETLQNWNGFWLPVRNTSVSSSFLLGASEMTIEYLNYDISVKAPDDRRLP
jgi:hypothetical protein